ncbi:Esterase/lipase/thioesterase family protein isoform 2 [Hibiscus syriacus]|uniref:Esterase/lipase/thioesterase family protein isoform 2 n=1 Tax=Hibiscus syriacus TaxID=106335 RepID=A0A6A2Y5D9_HIBSY|nr:Esterase/lipase/thioesterase family protein isoform 2 [Hibiscus syriacus]
MATKFDIEKFNGRNFSLWKLKMKAILRKDGCLAAISERPIDFTDDNKWIEMDGNAMANFHLALADELTSLSCKIGEQERAELLLQSLPDSYDQLIINLTNSNVTSLVFDDVAAAVLQEENRRKNKEDRQVNLQQAEALTTMKTMRGRSTERGQSSSHKHGRSKSRSKKNLKCYNCGKKGHLKNDCWSLNKNSNPQGNTANTSDDGDALCCEASTTVEGRKRFADIWLIDSGATYHKTSRREWFHHYEPMYDGTIKVVRDVRHVKGLKKNLLSYGLLDNNASKIETRKGIMKVFRGALVVLKGEKIAANLYMLKEETLLEAEASVASCSSDSAMLWHKKLGHMSEQGMKVLVEQKLLPGLTKVSLTLREHCITSKQHLLKFNTSNSRGKSILELVHSDVWHAPVTSLGGAKYFVSFIDDYSRRCWVYPIKKKSDVFSTFKNFKERVELDSGNKIKCFRTDNGREYTSEEFDDFCRKEGIKRQFTVTNTPQQNGVAERMNKTLLERTRAMLRDAGLEKSFWAEAINTSCYLVYRAPSTAIELKTPMEMWTGKPSDYSNLHVFGSIVYVMYNSQEISKLDPKSRKYKFLGYADGVKGYRLWYPIARKVIISRDVIFVEDKLQRKEDDDSVEKSETTQIHVEKEFEEGDSSEAEPAHDEQEPESSKAPTTRQSNRVRRRPNWHSDYVIECNIAYCLLTEDGEPSTYQEAINSSDASLWMMAMQEEIEALHKNNTWDLVPLPQGRKPIGNKWVFKIKRNGDDQVERYRARLVVKGYAQKEGFEEEEKKNCRLNKSLYGLKQAPRCWYKRFDSFIMCLGYNRLNADPCAYFKRSGDNDFVILLLYVDDMLVAGPNKDHIEELKAQLAREFEMKDLGSANKILGMQIHRDRSNRKIWLSQKNYLKKILSRFSMQDCKPISTPLPINFKLSSSMSPSSEEERMEMSRVPYASAVGSLMFAMICTRPNIAQAVGVVSRYMANPGKEHWNIVKRILRYIKETSNVALYYEGSNLLINGYVDSDYAGGLDKSKSTTGYVFKVAGGAVSWVSKLQSVVATSTKEAEYVAATQASKEAIWLTMLLEELGHNQEYVSLFCDSQSALHLVRNPTFHSRTKHIRVQYHFIREKVEEGTVDMQKIHSKDNITDFMTNAINADKFTWCRSSCGLSETSDNSRSPNRQIYLEAESLGACPALSVAARNPNLDLVLVSSNPATSFNKSQWQTLIPLLDIMPDQFPLNLPYMLSLPTGNPLRMLMDNVLKRGLLPQTIENLSQNFATMSTYLPVLADILPRETLRWKLNLLKSGSDSANSFLHAVKAQILLLCSGRDQLLPSQEECQRLQKALPDCEIRKFEESGHFLFMEDNVDLVTNIKAAAFYRRGKQFECVSDYVPPTPWEFKKVHESMRWLLSATGPVMLSTLQDGKVVRGLEGIPSEGPVLFVGYHMLLGIEIVQLVAQLLMERNILVRGITHPMIFVKEKDGNPPQMDPSNFDIFRLMGSVPVSAASFFKLMSSKSHILLYPGGARETLHRKGEAYKLFWPEKTEFVRMAARFGAKIVPFGVVGEDDVAEIILDYDDQMKIPWRREEIERVTNRFSKVRADASGKVANQQMHLPVMLPKFPGRLYYYFGKPILTEGMKMELRDKKKCDELYQNVKSEVEGCIEFLKHLLMILKLVPRKTLVSTCAAPEPLKNVGNLRIVDSRRLDS